MITFDPDTRVRSLKINSKLLSYPLKPVDKIQSQTNLIEKYVNAPRFRRIGRDYAIDP